MDCKRLQKYSTLRYFILLMYCQEAWTCRSMPAEVPMGAIPTTTENPTLFAGNTSSFLLFSFISKASNS